MALSLHVGKKSFEIGTASFLKSFFSTIYIHLENKLWGSKFPMIMNEFYSGKLLPHLCGQAIVELEEIHKQLKNLSPEQIVWDFENLNDQPPWGNNISQAITSLANYFWTSDGKDLFIVLQNAFEEGLNTNEEIIIQ